MGFLVIVEGLFICFLCSMDFPFLFAYSRFNHMIHFVHFRSDKLISKRSIIMSAAFVFMLISATQQGFSWKMWLVLAFDFANKFLLLDEMKDLSLMEINLDFLFFLKGCCLSLIGGISMGIADFEFEGLSITNWLLMLGLSISYYYNNYFWIKIMKSKYSNIISNKLIISNFVTLFTIFAVNWLVMEKDWRSDFKYIVLAYGVILGLIKKPDESV